jgi:hypothetical protein
MEQMSWLDKLPALAFLPMVFMFLQGKSVGVGGRIFVTILLYAAFLGARVSEHVAPMMSSPSDTPQQIAIAVSYGNIGAAVFVIILSMNWITKAHDRIKRRNA